MNCGWMLAGDFNDIASPFEKKGGVINSSRKCAKFVERINKCHLMDLGASGSKYTWRGTFYHGGARIYEKFDRGLNN
jgi:hypothetical protein